MLKALFNTYTANSTVAGSQAWPADLEGEWLPVRHDEWYNRLPGKHSQRARSSSTKMTYDSSGKGSGWVGEVFVNVQARSVAPGRYSSKFQVRTSSKTLPWAANDGRMTILEDGTLEVQYPSHGIREYWRRADGGGSRLVREVHKQRQRAHSADIEKREHSRSIKLVFRHFGNSLGARNDGYFWHWGLSIDNSIYEVNGAMAVLGPNGIVAASTPMAKNIRTNLNQFHGYLTLQQATHKTDEEIEEFTRRWVKLHPVYKALGPNCQTYTEDLFAFLTGEDLPFAKFADKTVGKGGNSHFEGPEASPSAVWLDASKKPR
jgi:hypothetical protein